MFFPQHPRALAHRTDCQAPERLSSLIAVGWFQSLFMTLLLLVSTSAFAAQGGLPPQVSGELFFPSSNAQADLDAAMHKGREANKRVLVVLGANWCHDSRALASRLYQQPLHALVQQEYELLLVDVGYLDSARGVIRQLGPPVYYATPTVLIVDPFTGQLLNENNRHQWGEAYTISMEDSVAYFEAMASTDGIAPAQSWPDSAESKRLQADIAAFEAQLAERVYAAYSVIGPMLKSFKNGDENGFDEQVWNEVRDFRLQVPEDVAALRVDALQRMAAGETGIELLYPTYPPFSWE